MKKQETLRKNAFSIYQTAIRCNGRDLLDYYNTCSNNKRIAYKKCCDRIPNIVSNCSYGVASANSWRFTFYATFIVDAVRSDGVKTKLIVYRYESDTKLDTIILDKADNTYYEVSCEEDGYRYVLRDNSYKAIRAWNVERG